jgi:hypothetical protein
MAKSTPETRRRRFYSTLSRWIKLGASVQHARGNLIEAAELIENDNLDEESRNLVKQVLDEETDGLKGFWS